MAQEQDIDQDLGELENRLERLRILYEQYFMGIEKREPGVQHKDVERRIQQLRKVRFPSTAARFKFQTMVQRFNTLQQYWTRTCREIENGTYQRHLQRAARRLATVPPQEATADGALPDGKEREKARKAAVDDLGALLEENVDLETELASALAAVEKAPAPRPKLPASPGLTLGKAPALKSLSPDAKPSISPRLSTSPKPPGLGPIERSPAAPSAPTAPNPLTALGRQNPQIKEAPPKVATNSVAKAPSPLTTLAPLSAGKSPLSAGRAPAPLPPAPREAPGTRLTGAAAQTRASGGVPPRAEVKKATPEPAPQEKRAAAAAQADAGLSGERIKALHASYVEARRQTNASPVSYEKLEQNIRETEKKLREQHKGRQVDFEVGIKDGKAILKPRLK